MSEKRRSKPVENNISNFFQAITDEFTISSTKPRIIAVTHLLRDRPFYLEALSRQSSSLKVLAKKNSVDIHTMETLKDQYHIEIADRDRMKAVNYVMGKIKPALRKDERLILMDIGGYFAPTLHELKKKLGDRLIGVIEDTENGVQQYESLDGCPCPVVSVARSPLKNTEDYLVGQAVLHSGEHLIRLMGQVLQGKEACVIGFGKIGRSVASGLQAKNVNVAIVDTNPVRCVEAMSFGYRVIEDHRVALKESDVVVCATGKYALDLEKFQMLKPGAIVFTVTSSDSELNLNGIQSVFDISADDFPGVPVERYSTDGKFFYLLNKGNAVNFLHGAVVGDFIYLVQSEMIAALEVLSSRSETLVESKTHPGIFEVSNNTRERIASIWMSKFN